MIAVAFNISTNPNSFTSVVKLATQGKYMVKTILAIISCFKVRDIRLLRFDHDSTTDKFRGWICNNCNAGMGNLGDTVEGLQKAIDYLNRHNE